MNNCFNKSIGGFSFHFTSETKEFPSTCFFNQPPLYQLTGPDQKKIKVTLLDQEYGHTPDLVQLFATDGTWRYLKYQDKPCLAFWPKHIEKPYFVAEFTTDFSKCRIYCNKQFPSKIRNPLATPFDKIFLFHLIIAFQGLLFHSSFAKLNEFGLMFSGKSGQGKTTIARLFEKYGSAEILSDECVAVRKLTNGFFAFGTPWSGEGNMAVNDSSKISALFFIHHGSQNKIKKISSLKIIQRVFPVTSIPYYDKKLFNMASDFLDEFIKKVPVYDFYFTKDAQAVSFLIDFIKKETQ